MAIIESESTSQPGVTPISSPVALLETALAFATVRTFHAGEPILDPGAATNAFYYLMNGAVEVSYTDPSDTRITVALIGAGEFFGEIGFFDGESRVRDIQAAAAAEVAIFNATVMTTLRAQQPELYMDFLVFLTQKICGKFRRIAGEREPIAGYAESLSTRHASRYTAAKPLPAPLVRSSLWHQISSRMEELKSELFNLSHRLQKTEAEGKHDPESEARCHQVLESAQRFVIRIRTDHGRQRVRGGHVGLCVQGNIPLFHAQPLCRTSLLQAQRLCRRFPHDGAYLRRISPVARANSARSSTPSACSVPVPSLSAAGVFFCATN